MKNAVSLAIASLAFAVFGSQSVKPDYTISDLTQPGDERASSSVGEFLNDSIKPGNAFDDIVSGNEHRIITKSNSGAVDIIYTFDRPTTVDSYELFLGPISENTYLVRAPKTWTFQGSDDGIVWTTLDEQENETGWAINESRYYKFTNGRSYLKYRLYITSNNGADPSGNSYIQFWELAYYNSALVDLTDSDATKVSSTTGSFAFDTTGPANAFDNLTTGSDHRVLSANGCMTFDIIYTFDEPVVVNEYHVLLGPVDLTVRAPKQWRLEGSNDGGASWTLLDVRKDETGWARNETRSYEFNNNTAYTSYRFLVLGNNGKDNNGTTGNYVQFWELEYLYNSDVPYVAFSPKDYAHSCEVTVTGYTGDETLRHFPVLMRLNEGDHGFSYADFALADGGDLRFATLDGHVLDHEIDTWNPDGESLVWVKVPVLDNGCKFLMCYGNANAFAALDSDVWNAYAGVWHLTDTVDSTANGHTQGARGSITVADQSLLGKGRTLGGSGSVMIPSPMSSLSSVSNFTVSVWMKPSSTSATARLVSTKKSASGTGVDFIYSSGTGGLWLRGDGNSKTLKCDNLSGVYTVGEWSWLTIVCDGTTGRIYNNGTLLGSGAIDPVSTRNDNLYVGSYGDGGNANYMSGEVDEIRVYNGAASADRIKAEYDSMHSQSFLTVRQVTDPGTVIVLF